MAEIIIMPKLGFNMDEGQLIQWHKQVGDSVSKGEVLFEINTDKTTMPVEATVDGVMLETLLEEGAFAEVFTPICVIGVQGEDYSAALAAARNGGESGQPDAGPVENQAQNPEKTPLAAATAAVGEFKLSPKAKKLVQDEGIDPASLKDVQGTGYQGGITARDIKASPLAKKIAAATGVDLSAVTGSGAKGKIMKADVMAAQSAQQDNLLPDDDRKVLSITPYKGVRKIIGDKLAESKFTAPHLYFTDSVDTTELSAMRSRLNEMAEVKITVSDLLTMAAAKALKKYPAVNASLIDGNILQYKSINVGTAVAGKNGLIVPVVRDVQEKTLTDVACESKDLVSWAKEGRLNPSEYDCGTFTISNLGMFGIENFTAIINGTESAILAVSSVRKKAIVLSDEDGEDRIEIRPMMNIQLSVDHRLIDGLLAAQFLGYIKQVLENPMEILI